MILQIYSHRYTKPSLYFKNLTVLQSDISHAITKSHFISEISSKVKIFFDIITAYYNSSETHFKLGRLIKN